MHSRMWCSVTSRPDDFERVSFAVGQARRWRSSASARAIDDRAVLFRFYDPQTGAS